jgi:phospholipid/cholesterol/gamma-HCH transport system substrate-binding protein
MYDAQKQFRWSKLKVGIVITVALVILLITVFFAGNLQSLIARKFELRIDFRNVEGLRNGAPIWILGLEEGSVKDIRLDPTYGVIVTVAIQQRALRYLKKDSQATILTMGLLGDKYIELSTGSPQANPIQPGDLIKGTTEMGFKHVMETSGEAIGKISQFINKVDSFVEKIENSQGTLGKLLNDPSLYNHLDRATQRLSSLVDDLKNTRGTLGLLIEDPSVYNRLLSAASSLEAFSKRINESSGTLKSLIEDPSLYNQTKEAVSQIQAFGTSLNRSQGTIKKMIDDPAVYENLNKDLKELSSILERIEKGQGLAGAFVQDTELSKELKDTLAELKDLLKTMKSHPGKYFKFKLF